MTAFPRADLPDKIIEAEIDCAINFKLDPYDWHQNHLSK